VSPLPLGAHQSIAGGTPNAVARALSTGCRVLQIFVKNSNRWVGKDIRDEEAEEFRSAAARSGLTALLAHSSYLINAASPEGELRERSIEALIDELERCDRLGVPALVLHPGSRGEASSVEGVARIARALDEVFTRGSSRARILLETAAGQGACVGSRFEELRDILGASAHPERLGVCLDTCHVFAAGYELRTDEGFAETMAALERTVGIDRVEAIHVNDSKKEKGSRVDRHEHIGKGHIGAAGFRRLLAEPRLRAVPKYLETAKDPDLAWDRKNLAVLRRLAGEKSRPERRR